MFQLNFKLLLINLLIFLIYINDVKLEQEDFFSAVSEMESMVSTESILIDYLQNYLSEAEIKLNKLKKTLTDHKTEYSDLKQKINQSNEIIQSVAKFKYLSNFTKNFYQLEDLLEEGPREVILKNLTEIKKNTKFPTEDDLLGSIIGLARLQDVYNLTIDDLTKALNSRSEADGPKLTLLDYYGIAVELYHKDKFVESSLWFTQALNHINDSLKVDLDDDIPTRFHLIEMLSYVHYRSENYELAIYYTEELLKMKPNFPEAELNLKAYRAEKKNIDVFLKKFPTRNLVESKDNVLHGSTKDFLVDVFAGYKSGCRNELKRSIRTISRLECWYLTETDNFLKYAPIKLEEVNFDPEIFIYHDVIYDSEIEIFKNLVKGKMIRAKVWDTKINSEYIAEYRTNKLAWLDTDAHPIIKRIRQRVGDMTGLSMKTAEQLQVANYGIGGHYEPHHDYHHYNQSEASFPISELGDRLSTLIFYLTDVKSGGATVFPLLNITVYPQKGSAIFWYNLFSNGIGDLRTFHAACPVLEGDKWILNQWLHERDQEFRRPCQPKDNF